MTRTFSVLFFGVLVASFGSIFTRWAGDVPYAVISFYRLFLSIPLLLIFYFVNNNTVKIPVKYFRFQFLLAGFFLAAHFITWIASIQLTSIANSIFLESTHPFFALILSIIFLKEYPRLSLLPAFIVAIIGIFLMVYSDWNLQNSKTIGDLLAMSSALFLALYLLIARKNRGNIDLTLYLIYVYAMAALFCGIYILIMKQNFIGFSWVSWFFMLLLALGPNLIGHSLLNWASRKIEIFKVNLMMLLEPVLATIMGIIFLYEFPGLNFYLGATLIIMALIYIISNERYKTSDN
jgi:drug/metabolite transporter (DMT)-like permease